MLHRPPSNSRLLDIRDLRTVFDTDRGPVVAVDGVSLAVHRGQTVALVGESGCGKSATALSIMRLLPEPTGRIAGGRIVFDDVRQVGPVDITSLSERDMRKLRGRRIAMVFQEPMTSLNPVLTVGAQIIEAIELHQRLRRRKSRQAAIDLLGAVGIVDPARRIRDYPHQLSGGMRQRVLIAIALSCRPSLLIADEPTTALDVTVQAQILDLLRDIQTRTGLSILFITHDLGVVAQIADYVYVMYAGKIVEHAPVGELFSNPLHPYTQGLLRCTPRIDRVLPRLEVIEGQVPDAANPPTGCRFHPRCPLAARNAPAPTEPRPSGSGSSNAPLADTIQVEGTLKGAVLRRCVEKTEGTPSGEPPLSVRDAHHTVACWEV